MKYTIYQIRNKLNGKVYVGKHQTEDVNDGYFGSGVALRRAVKKHGKENFEKEILFVFDSEEEMNQKEKEIITEEFVSRKDTYNLGVGGEGGPHFKGKKHSKESIEKMLEKRGTYSHTDEAKKKIAESNRRRTVSPETRRKLAEKARQRKQTDETKRKLSEIAQKRKNDAG